MTLLSPRPLSGQGWPCRESNPLLLRTGKGVSVVQREMSQLMEVVMTSLCHCAVRLEIPGHLDAERCHSIWPNKLFQCLLHGGSHGTAWEEQSQALHLGRCQALHAPLHPGIIKWTVGWQARGQRQLLPVRSAPLHLSEKGRRGGKGGRRRISRHGWVHSSPAYASQSCH